MLRSHFNGKNVTLSLFFFLLALMAAATLLESKWGSEWVSDTIYHTPWFCVLWGLLVLLMLGGMVKYQLWHRFSVMMLHLSFIVILAGALTTYLTSHKGIIHLQQGQKVSQFQSEDFKQTYPLPFSLRLDTFRVIYYPGTEAAADYVSHITLTDQGADSTREEDISMNNILKHAGYRFYQSSYDDNGRGSWLSVNYDPVGTGITYLGYILLGLSMLMTVFDRREEFRRLLRHPLLRKGTLVLGLLLTLSVQNLSARELPAFNRSKADSLATKQIIYNDRVAPFNTMALDFMRKLYGRDTYHGLSAEQVVTGWLFRPEVWQDEPMILVKSQQLRSLLHIEGKYASLSNFFANGTYVLNQYWKGDDTGNVRSNDPLQKAIAEVDEKVGLIMMLQKGTLFRPLPKDHSVARLSPLRVKAELLYNRIPFAKILFMLSLTLGLVAFGRLMVRYLKNAPSNVWDQKVLPITLYALTLTLTFAFALRWYIADHVPLSNGMETMQFMALVTLCVAAALHRRFAVLLPFGALLAGFALLVSFLGQNNPQVTHLMPVLSSPWLSLHVSVVMMGYSLLAFLFLNGLMGLLVSTQAERLLLLGRLMLYPAVFFLGIGIFLGAVWANQSWGSYWSWDAKETWALITFMLYATLFHAQSLPWLRRPRSFHWFCVVAFATVLMTYFGVNYFLGGMHSYA